MAAIAEIAGDHTGIMHLLSLVWIELVMAGLAAFVYVALSGKVIPPRLSGKGKCLAQITGPRFGTRSIHGSAARGAKRGTSDTFADARAETRRTSGGRRPCAFGDDSGAESDLPGHGYPTVQEDVVDVAAMAKAIRTCGKSGDLTGALDIYERLRKGGHGASSFLFNSLLDACIECGDLERAVSFFERAKNRNFITVVSYNTMMKGYLARGKVADAERLLREISERGMTATQASYHGLMQSRLHSGSVAGAWGMVQEMQNNGIAPNAVTCAIMLKGVMSSSSDVRRVLQMIQTMSTPMDEVLFSLVVEACLGIDRLDLLSFMRSLYAKQGGPCGITAPLYGTMIKSYGRAHDVATVWELWTEMRTHQVKLTSITVGCMVEALVANRHPENAWDLVEELWAEENHRSLVNTVIYSTIIKGFVSSKQPDKVMALYEEMRSRGVQPNAITYNTILNAFAQCKAMHRAPQLLKEMLEADPRIEPDIITYSTIVKGYCSAGDLDKALELLSVMKNDAKLKPDEVTYNSLLDGCAKQNRLEEALELVTDMRDAGVPASNFTLSILVKLMGRSKRLNQAFSMVDTISAQYGFQVNVQVYTCLIQACFNNRQPVRAFALHERMIHERLPLDEKAYTALLRGCLQSGYLDRAVHITRCAYANVDGQTAPPGVEQRRLEELLAALGQDSEVGRTLMREISACCQGHHQVTSVPQRRAEPMARGQMRFRH